MSANTGSATPGWLAIFAFAGLHNIVQAGRGKEMLSQASRRARRAHPVLFPLAALALYAHLMGYLNPRVDPLYWLGEACEHALELIRALRGA